MKAKKREIICKSYRILSLYVRLLEGKCINKEEEAVLFQVDTRSIQRDISDIRAFLAYDMVARGGCMSIVYDRKRKGYLLCKAGQEIGRFE